MSVLGGKLPFARLASEGATERIAGAFSLTFAKTPLPIFLPGVSSPKQMFRLDKTMETVAQRGVCSCATHGEAHVWCSHHE